MKIIYVAKRLTIGALFLAATACYVLRAFHPEQPLHHELNDAAGALLIAAFLVLIWTMASE